MGPGLSRFAASVGAAGSIALLLALIANHLPTPIYLEIMEGAVVQHIQRAVAGQSIYTAPSSDFVPLAYNPLYYLASVPLTWIFGVGPTAARILAVAGMAGIAWVLFAAVRRETGSRWWGFIAAGLFAAAYGAMDGYLDSAHADSTMLFAALLGSYWLARHDSLRWRLAAMAVLAAAFWFKQHGALFAAGGLAWMARRDDPVKSAGPALFLLALGPALYTFAGPALFGSHFHYFTWQVPSAWTEPEPESLARIARLLLGPYLLLTAAGAWHSARTASRPTVWHVQFAAAALSAVLGALDPGSSNNVFAGLGILVILWGTLGLHAAWHAGGQTALAARLALPAAFLTMAYNPADYWIPAEAASRLGEFTRYVESLDGPVYIPKWGPVPLARASSPAAHWVALEDMVRGRGRDERNHPLTRRLLAAVVEPTRPAYLIMHNPLEPDPLLGFLAADYRLVLDMGDRYRMLGNVPHRFGVVWPRYVYRCEPPRAAATASLPSGARQSRTSSAGSGPR